MADAMCVVGRVPGDGRWLGLARQDADYALIVGDGDGERRTVGDRRGLLAVAMAHFLGVLDDPPDEREATQQDLAELVAWLLHTEARPAVRVALREALDAIEDGLAVDVVATRLEDALEQTPALGAQSEVADLVLPLLNLA